METVGFDPWQTEEQECEHEGLLEPERVLEFKDSVAVIYRCLGCGEEVAEFDEVQFPSEVGEIEAPSP